MTFRSKIVVSDDFEAVRTMMVQEFSVNSLRFIPKNPANEFLIEDARAVERESYIAESSEKIIIMMAYLYKNEAQNFLLKLLEEPPRNIKFLLVVPSKNLLLPTIKSRLVCERIKSQKQKRVLNFDLKRLDLQTLFEFLRENENLDKNELMDTISLLAQQSMQLKDFNARELEFFYEAYELAGLNCKSGVLLASLLLNFYTKEK
ncbi:DNA polymerase III subunit delta' [Campylobacter sp. MIT 21-1685]|uniref:DNA polymerase III subunit delta' n=1 Tax=unclassified Campylobacter TaxID=2593542 RepID=UPI00224B9652|nr:MULTISPECIES: DNA polymerase III subunit delta' [unclassified Campylobacter]MCX2682358.1 DNA polymerase III subunit delta' [Campylobacter sp. MIT 21-1684]MCX2750638.1 DNA polymerase III subunit delta' [Campylobacter sp. MIT 21-1682]MCX2806814.1 DNA polymerase III subunit delta' [Campylobacter sp. MIT 21-1685]